MQEKNRISSHFSQRTEILSERLGVLLRDLPSRIGISDRMFYGYRSGSYPISCKAWRKLEAAERAAGIGVPESTAVPTVGGASAEPPPDHGDPPAEVVEQLARLQDQIARMQQQFADALAPLRDFPMAELRARMDAAGAWPPSGSDLALTPGQLMAKYPPR